MRVCVRGEGGGGEDACPMACPMKADSCGAASPSGRLPQYNSRAFFVSGSLTLAHARHHVRPD